MHDDSVLQVLRAYPQIYHACHLRHPRVRTNARHVSDRDAFILGHLDLTRPTSPAELARHLSLRASTVSESVKRLVRLGYIARRAADHDRRRVDLYLTEHGIEALEAGSILDPDRVERLLAQLSDAERAAALDGIALLAQAARSLNAQEPKQWLHGEP